MKKAAVLLIVLAVASLSNAEIMISVNGDTDVDYLPLYLYGTVTIGIYNTGGDTPIDFISYLDFSDQREGAYSLSNPRLGPAAGDWPAYWNGPYIIPPPDDNYEEIEFTQIWKPGSAEIPGEIFLIDVHCENPNIGAVVTLWDTRVGFDYPVDELAIWPVPEPAAIALLGLGALFVRKRKK